MLPKIFDTH